MSKVKFSEIIWPKKMNLNVFSEILSEKEFVTLLEKYFNRPRSERRIILPSEKCIRKCYVFSLVERCGGDFDEVMKALKGDERFLKNVGLRRDKIRELYNQRKKEIENE